MLPLISCRGVLNRCSRLPGSSAIHDAPDMINAKVIRIRSGLEHIVVTYVIVDFSGTVAVFIPLFNPPGFRQLFMDWRDGPKIDGPFHFPIQPRFRQFSRESKEG